MKVKSKYNLKDSVWFMEYNHVQNGIVSGIFFRTNYPNLKITDYNGRF